MFARRLQRITLSLVTVVACSTTERHSVKDTTVLHASADSSVVTTHEMVEALTRDVRESDRQLTAAEDSIYAFMGDTVSALLKQARTSWEQYRKLECDAIGVAFAQGSMAPIAQTQCWIDLTDDYRRFLTEQFGYMRSKRTRPGKPTR